MSKTSGKKSVVVVGGGGAGAAIARTLSAKLDSSSYTLTLVTARPFAVHYPAAIRMTTSSEGKLEDSVLISYDHLLQNGNGSIKVGRVVSIDAKKESKGGQVILESGESIWYDALVLAPGSHWDGPLELPDSRSDVISFINSWRRKFEGAQNIVLGGGGAVGIEYAGEIKDFWPNKKVTIVHGGSLLLNKSYPDKFRKLVEKNIRKRGIEIVFNDYVDDFSPNGAVQTRKGKTINADLVVPTHGNRPATEFVSSLGPDTLNGRGQIKVRSTLQLEKYAGIFAAGDVIDWEEQKQVTKAGGHAGVVVANVLTYLSGKTPSKEYGGSPELIIITNGKNSGVAYMSFLWGITLGPWFAKMTKSKGLMIPMARKSYGHAS